jgi:DNA-binding response OmpR family regulator
MAQDSEGRVAINEVRLPTADMVRLDRQTPVDCMHHTILVVDDDTQVRTLCRLTLEESGYLVSEATNGKNALAAIEETDFALIVLDLAMPDMDGFEFLKGVRAKSPKPKILVISGFLGGTMLAAAKLFGAAATLAKAFSPDSLLLVVSEVLAKKGPAGSSD